METIAELFYQQKQHAPKVAKSTAKERIKKLRLLEREILKRQQQINNAVSADFRKPELETNFTETFLTLHEIRHTIRHISKWMRPKKISRTLLSATTRSEIRYESKGVVLIISPWNFPIHLALMPLVSAIAAGNCAIIKPSEFAPNAAKIIEEIIEAVFPRGETAIIQGDKEVAEQLLQLPFDHIFFTGSPEVGKIVMKAAADHYASVTLELGGKSPSIIDADADIDDAALKLALGKFMNCGQACIAPDYILVHHSQMDNLLVSLKRVLRNAYGDASAAQKSPNLARIINSKNYERIENLLNDAVAKGAQINTGGEKQADDLYIAPTLLTNIPQDDCKLMEEEIFGPLLPIIPFETIDDAIRIINNKPKPLAMYIFSHQHEHVERILNETRAGGTTVNDFGWQYLQFNLPFGGVGMSGFGSTHGKNGFLAFSHERAVVYHHKWSPLKLFAPPYTKFKINLTKLLIKYF